MPNQFEIYVVDSGSVATTPTIYKFERSNATAPSNAFTTSAGYPVRGITIGGTNVSYDARGVTGWANPDEGGKMYLLLTSSAGLVKFDTVDFTFSLLAEPCGGSNMQYRGIALAPIRASATPSLTASRTPTATVSMSTSLSASPTPSVTAGASVSSSITATPTMTATMSPLCAPATANPGYFSRFSAVVLRVGDGRLPLPASGSNVAREAFIDEYDINSGQLRQTIALPTGAATVNANGALSFAGCAINAGFVNNGLVTRSVDGRTLAIACHPLAPGASITTTANRTLLSVKNDGSTIPAALMTSYLSSTGVLTASTGSASVSQATTQDGSDFFFSTGSGPFYIAAGRVGPAQQASTTAAVGISWDPSSYPGWVYRVSSTGSIAYLGPSGGNGTARGAYTNCEW